MTDAQPGWRAETFAACETVERALLIAQSGTGDIHFKVGRDVVTDTDLAIEDQIRASLGPAFGLPVVGEERGGDVRDANAYWLVDPICGTRNFASGIPLFAINVALVEEGEVTLAVVGDGSIGSLLVAERGKGSWSYEDFFAQRLATSSASRTIDFELLDRTDSDRVRTILGAAAAVQLDRWDIRFFASSLSLGYVASGRLAGCVFFDAPPAMHIPAGVLLVTEAGAVATELTGGPWALDSASLVCSADEVLHREVLGVIGRAADGP